MSFGAYTLIGPCIIIFLLWLATLPLHPLHQIRMLAQPVVQSTWIERHVHEPSTEPKRHGYFLHITDFHADDDYIEGGTVASACHRAPNSTGNPGKEALGGPLGAPGERCDAPLKLVQQTLDWVAGEWRDKIDFVIWTGDNSRHNWDKKYRRTKRQVVSLNRQVTAMVMDTFGGIPVVPCLGNNDVYPHNQISENDDMLWFFGSIWRQWIPVEQRSRFRHGGYFSMDLGYLKVISLNTMYFSKHNAAVKNCRKHGPAHDHMSWLEGELESARRHGRVVLIMGHIPPSPRDYRKTCFNEYIRLTTGYADIIIGQLFGHLNMDHFLVYREQQRLTINETPVSDSELHAKRDIEKYVDWLYGVYRSLDPPDNEEEVPSEPSPPNPPRLSVIHVAPSVLPVYTPTLRVYRYVLDDSQKDQVTGLGPAGLLGYTQYYANISDWREENGSLAFHFEYDTQTEYGLDDLSAYSISSFIKEMISENTRLWTTYTRNMFVRTHNDTFPAVDI